jgi:hypothetical protein
MKIENLSNEIIMEWDVVNWSRALPFWQKKTKLNLADSKCLEIGSRNGGLCLWLSNICKSVTYSDLTTPTQKCIDLHAEYKPTNIQYKIVDATKPIALDPQDIIVTKSIMGALDIPLRKAMIENICNGLKSGGEYWFVENLNGAWLHQFLRNKFVPWGSRWTYLKVEEIPQAFSMFKEVEFITFGFLGTLGRNNFQRNVLGFIDKLFFDKLVPKRMHYIVAGVARK